MAFNVDDRVKVTNQHSVYRNALGVVKADNGSDNYAVRMDGYAAAGRTNFDDDELVISTQAVPITY